MHSVASEIFFAKAHFEEKTFFNKHFRARLSGVADFSHLPYRGLISQYNAVIVNNLDIKVYTVKNTFFFFQKVRAAVSPVIPSRRCPNFSNLDLAQDPPMHPMVFNKGVPGPQIKYNSFSGIDSIPGSLN